MLKDRINHIKLSVRTFIEKSFEKIFFVDYFDKLLIKFFVKKKWDFLFSLRLFFVIITLTFLSLMSYSLVSENGSMFFTLLIVNTCINFGLIYLNPKKRFSNINNKMCDFLIRNNTQLVFIGDTTKYPNFTYGKFYTIEKLEIKDDTNTVFQYTGFAEFLNSSLNRWHHPGYNGPCGTGCSSVPVLCFEEIKQFRRNKLKRLNKL